MDSFGQAPPPLHDAAVEPAPCPAPRDDPGELPLRMLFRLAGAGALLGAMVSLIACGGSGGGTSSPPAPPPPAPASSLIPPQLSVPTPVGYDADRLAAFNRLNEIRLSAGLGMLAQSTAMDQAAQAHAVWMVANDSFTHVEVAGTTGFTGERWWDRDKTFGYLEIGGTEVIAQSAHGLAEVDALINSAYHRQGLLAFEPVDIGVGWSAGVAKTVSMPLVIDVSMPGGDPIRGAGQTAQPSVNGVVIWPLNGANNVPTALGLESPNPVPSQAVQSLGTPVSIEVDEVSSIAVSSFELTNGTTGAVVPTTLLTAKSDPNGLVQKSFVAAIPLAVLTPSTAYKVIFLGSSLNGETGATTSIQKAWSFTTASP